MFDEASPSERAAAIDAAYLRFHGKQDPAALCPLIRNYDQYGLANTIASAVEIPKVIEATAARVRVMALHLAG